MRTARSLSAFVVFIFSWLFLVSPPIAADTEYRITACRLFDSRNIGSGSKITSSSSINIATREDAGSSQGGETGCGAPSTAGVVKLNIVLLLPESSGWARLYPAGETEPLSTTINASSGVTNETNGADIPVGDDGEITLNSSVSAAHYIIDLVGWHDAAGESREHSNPPYMIGPRHRRFLTFSSAPFAGLSPGDRLIVSMSGTVGPFVDHEGEWVYWDGSSWVFETPVDGDLAYESATGKYWKYRASLATWSEV